MIKQFSEKLDKMRAKSEAQENGRKGLNKDINDFFPRMEEKSTREKRKNWRGNWKGRKAKAGKQGEFLRERGDSSRRF